MIQDILDGLSNILTGVLNFLFDTVISLCYGLLSPVNNIISKYLPGVDYILTKIGSFFTYISNIIPWAISYFGLDSALLSLVVSYYVFVITVSILLYVIKLAIKWWNALKP